MIWRVLLLIFGVWACSTAVIFIKASTVQPVLLAGLRQLVAALVLTPVFIRELRKHRDTYTSSHLVSSLLPGAILGIHFVTWIIGARMTNSANASLIVNLVPCAMPFFLWAMMRERLTLGEIVGTGIAMSGVLLLGITDYHADRMFFNGDLICLLSMLFFCYYLALGRQNRSFPSVWLYVVPLYYTGGVLCTLAAVPFVNPFQQYSAADVRLILALGIVPTVIGHSILNISMRALRGQLVSIVNMGQFIFAGTMAFFAFGEVPAVAFYVASVLLVGGSLVVICAQQRAAQKPTGS